MLASADTVSSLLRAETGASVSRCRSKDTITTTSPVHVFGVYPPLCEMLDVPPLRDGEGPD